MIQKKLPFVVSLALFTIGLFFTIFPFTSGEKAYFAKDNLYINIKDSIDLGYQPYLKSLLQQELSATAFQEKKAIRDQYKSKGDSLDKASMTAALDKNNLATEKINIQKKELQSLIADQESEIDDKYSLAALPEETYQARLADIKEKTSSMSYVIAVARETIDPSGSTQLSLEDISVKKINQQNKAPFLVSGLFLAICGILLFLYQGGFLPLENTGLKYSITAILLIMCFIMANNIYTLFSNRITFDKTLQQRENEVKEKLLDIRLAELNYFEANKKYCNNWDDLIHFFKHDSIKIVKYLVNKDDTAAVNLAIRNGNPLETIEMVPALKKTFPNKNFDIDKIAIIPFTENEFQLNAGIIDKNGRNIHVFEVKTTKYEFVQALPSLPQNFDKSKSLVIGSMTEPTTEANW